jgi:hypothetical protein
MKKLLSLILLVSTYTLAAQRNRDPKMLPEYASGYYINPRGDTVKGQIQTNLGEKVDFYKQFAFKKVNDKRPRVYDWRRAKAYGFNGKHFVKMQYKGEYMYVERLISGRLAFYEYRFQGKVNGYPGVETDYFIRDTWAGTENPELGELKKISKKYYKKALKPYMKESQPILWEDLDKFNFDKQALLNTIREFNEQYTASGN